MNARKILTTLMGCAVLSAFCFALHGESCGSSCNPCKTECKTDCKTSCETTTCCKSKVACCAPVCEPKPPVQRECKLCIEECCIRDDCGEDICRVDWNCHKCCRETLPNGECRPTNIAAGWLPGEELWDFTSCRGFHYLCGPDYNRRNPCGHGCMTNPIMAHPEGDGMLAVFRGEAECLWTDMVRTMDRMVRKYGKRQLTANALFIVPEGKTREEIETAVMEHAKKCCIQYVNLMVVDADSEVPHQIGKAGMPENVKSVYMMYHRQKVWFNMPNIAHTERMMTSMRAHAQRITHNTLWDLNYYGNMPHGNAFYGQRYPQRDGMFVEKTTSPNFSGEHNISPEE